MKARAILVLALALTGCAGGGPRSRAYTVHFKDGTKLVVECDAPAYLDGYGGLAGSAVAWTCWRGDGKGTVIPLDNIAKVEGQ